MTEKELKKLSRLELLELLLEASKENQELKERNGQLKAQIETVQRIDKLSATVEQMEDALQSVHRLTANLQSKGCTDAPAAPVDDCPEPSLLDKEIYRRLLKFYSENPALATALPLELQYAIRERGPAILNREP